MRGLSSRKRCFGNSLVERQWSTVSQYIDEPTVMAEKLQGDQPDLYGKNNA